MKDHLTFENLSIYFNAWTDYIEEKLYDYFNRLKNIQQLSKANSNKMLRNLE